MAWTAASAALSLQVDEAGTVLGLHYYFAVRSCIRFALRIGIPPMAGRFLSVRCAVYSVWANGWTSFAAASAIFLPGRCEFEFIMNCPERPLLNMHHLFRITSMNLISKYEMY
jgi:hypothetical protein